jgi:hypothetical protein
MRDDLFRILSAMTERVRADAAVFGVDSDQYLAGVWTEIEKFSRRIGLPEDESGPPDDPTGDSEPAGKTPGPDAANAPNAPGHHARE